MLEVQTYLSRDGAENGYLLTDAASKTAVVVDPAMDVGALLADCRERGIDITAICLTHGHFDHIESVDALVAATQAALYIPEPDLPMLTSSRGNLSAFLGRAFTVTSPATPMADGDTVTFGEHAISYRLIGGHTPGSSALCVGDMAFCGDAVFADSIGRTDFPNGDYATLMRGIEAVILTMPDAMRLFPGHGQASTVGRIKQENPFLQ